MSGTKNRYQKASSDMRALELLGLPESADESDADEAFRTLVKKWHPEQFRQEPDKFREAEIKFTEIQGAYQILKRSRYLARNSQSQDKQDEMPIIINVLEEEEQQ